MTTYIYGLQCPLSGDVRYIGKSIAPTKRINAHIRGAVSFSYDHHTARWLRKLAAENLRPVLTILEEVKAGEDWRSIERSWIERARTAGWPLTNTTAGGEGLDYIDQGAKAAYLRNLSAAAKARMQTEAGRENLRKMNAAGLAPAVRAKRVAGLMAAWSDPQRRQAMESALRAMQNDPRARKKQSIASGARWAADHAGMVAEIWTPESRAKHRASRIAAWADHASRERMMTARWTPEARAKQAAEVLSRKEKIQAAMTPEVRAKQAAKLKETWAKRKAAAAENIAP